MNDKLTTIHFVRHGEAGNPSGQLYGWQPDFHLTSLGHAMTESATDFFDGYDLRPIISSPLERVQEATGPTAQRYGLSVVLDKDLTEAGDKLEGVNVNRDQPILARPQYWPWYVSPAEPSQGEPYAEIVVRLSGTVRRALRKAEGDETVLVSHQLPMQTMCRFVEGRPLARDPRKREYALYSVTSLTFVRRQFVGVSYDKPAAELVRRTRDVTPGASQAAIHTGL